VIAAKVRGVGRHVDRGIVRIRTGTPATIVRQASGQMLLRSLTGLEQIRTDIVADLAKNPTRTAVNHPNAENEGVVAHDNG